MNMDNKQFEGKWDQIKGQVKQKWGKLTNDDVTTIHGKSDVLVGKLKERYGYAKEKAENEVKSFMKECDCSTEAAKTQKRSKQTTREHSPL